MADKSPAFQFYARDFLSDEHVRIMCPEARGAYITLLCVCWLEGSIPIEDRTIAKVGDCSPEEWERVRADVLACFVLDTDQGRYRHKRLDAERHKQEQYSAKQSEAGKNGAAVRWQAHGKPIVSPMANDSSASASASALKADAVQDICTSTAVPYVRRKPKRTSPRPKGVDICQSEDCGYEFWQPAWARGKVKYCPDCLANDTAIDHGHRFVYPEEAFPDMTEEEMDAWWANPNLNENQHKGSS